MKHVYGIMISLLGLSFIGAALFCPIVKGGVAIITFLVGIWFLEIGTEAAGVIKWKHD